MAISAKTTEDVLTILFEEVANATTIARVLQRLQETPGNKSFKDSIERMRAVWEQQAGGAGEQKAPVHMAGEDGRTRCGAAPQLYRVQRHHENGDVVPLGTAETAQGAADLAMMDRSFYDRNGYYLGRANEEGDRGEHKIYRYLLQAEVPKAVRR